MFNRLGTDFTALPEDFPTVLPWMTAAVWKCSGPAHHPPSVSWDSVRRNLAGVRMEPSLKLHILLLLQRPALLCLPSLPALSQSRKAYPSRWDAGLGPARLLHRWDHIALVQLLFLCNLQWVKSQNMRGACLLVLWCAGFSQSHTGKLVKMTAGQIKKMHLSV